MGWVIFEVFLAFCLAIFIVWWTLPKARKETKQDSTSVARGKSAAPGDE